MDKTTGKANGTNQDIARKELATQNITFIKDKKDKKKS